MVSMCVAWLSCADDPHDLHAGPQPALGGSEDDVVSGDVASDSSDVDVLGGLCLTCACCSIAAIALLAVYVNKGGRSFKVECGNTRKSAHPPSLVRKYDAAPMGGLSREYGICS